jgi:hypothetical protein
MADAAEVLPLPDEEPVDETPKSDDSTTASGSGEDKGKGVSFGTFLTVGPKEFRNVTIVGYDSLRDSVRAVRRSGDTVENIQIPYDQFKTLLETQRQSDLATGRKPKKNLSGAVRGMFGKNVSLEGKAAQVIGYDAQNDEVLVNDDSGRRWMKSGDMLRSTQNVSSGTKPRDLRAVPAPTESAAPAEAARVVQDSGADIDPDKTAQIQRAFEQGRITVQDPPGQTTVGLSVDTTGKVLRQVETSSTTVQPSRIDYVSSRGESVALTDVDVAISEVTAPINIETTVSVQAAPQTTSVSSIRATREALQQTRSTSVSAAPVQGAAAAVAAVSAIIPASNTGALAAVAAAQNVLAAYDKSAAVRQNQLQQISNQISDVGNRINDLQQRSRQALSSGNGTQAAQFERQVVQAQADRTSLLDQQTDLQVTRINENNKAGQIVEAVQKLAPDENGVVPDEQVAAVQRLLPGISPTLTATPFAASTSAAAATALPTPPKVALPRTFAPGIPSRPTSAPVNPSVRTPKPLRPLTGGSSSYGAQTQRAADLYNAQQRDRQAGNGFSGAGSEEMMGQDAYETAFASEGGLPSFTGPLDIPERRTQSYAAGAEDEEEPADIYGSSEEESRARMADINRSLAGEGPATPQESVGVLSGAGRQPGVESITTSAPAPQPESLGPSPDEIARQAQFQGAIAATVLEQQQQEEQEQQLTAAAGATGEAASKAKQIQSAKAAISDVVDAFDAIHGFADVIGLIGTFAHLNARLVLTIFKKDLPLIPRANFPWECSAFFCFDIMVVFAALSSFIVPIIIFAAILAVLGGAAFGVADLLGAV